MRFKTTLLIGTLSLLANVSLASQTVLFVDGRTLEVESVERQDQDVTILVLDSGARMGVPFDRIANHQELERVAAEQAVAKSRAREASRLAAARPAPSAQAWRKVAGPYADVLAHAATKYGLEPALLTAVAQVESSFNPKAVSPKGAGGLLQLMPQTAKRFKVTDVFDPAQNVDGGAKYLSWLLRKYKGDTQLALAGYNAGEHAVDRYKGIPPYPETQTYVNRVVERLARFGGSAR